MELGRGHFRSLTSGRASAFRGLLRIYLSVPPWSYQTAALSLRSDATDLSVDQNSRCRPPFCIRQRFYPFSATTFLRHEFAKIVRWL